MDTIKFLSSQTGSELINQLNILGQPKVFGGSYLVKSFHGKRIAVHCPKKKKKDSGSVLHLHVYIAEDNLQRKSSASSLGGSSHKGASVQNESYLANSSYMCYDVPVLIEMGPKSGFLGSITCTLWITPSF